MISEINASSQKNINELNILLFWRDILETLNSEIHYRSPTMSHFPIGGKCQDSLNFLFFYLQTYL